MRLVYLLIFPALLIPIGQPAGESSVPVNTGIAATKATISNITIVKPSVKTTTKKKKIVHTKERKKDTNKTVVNSKQKSTQTETKVKQLTKTKSPKMDKKTDPKQSASQQKPTSNRELAASDTNILAVEREVVRLVNVERSKQGLKPLNLGQQIK
ncbi:hypothetical protein [Shimazuella alba]|uniref:Uncharacterized protein n=1 Tax=Shimazuella alba TaxID=2690964 RepID=A0A6I4VNI0_9BACL|nr:hypothetical protein [Shimazuella alba]MXQ53189.1 hypothetical protein [Shimazuella alba]